MKMEMTPFVNKTAMITMATTTTYYGTFITNYVVIQQVPRTACYCLSSIKIRKLLIDQLENDKVTIVQIRS